MAKTKKKTSKRGKKASKKKASARGKKKATRSSRPRPVPFNEKNALRQFADHADEDVDDLQIDDISGQQFTNVRAYQISTGATYGREWSIYRNEDDAEEEALARVKQDLENEPEIFKKDFIASHIDMDKVKQWVHDSVMEDDYVDELRPDDFWREFQQYRLDTSDYENSEGELEDDEGDTIDPPSAAIDELKEAIATDRASDPEGYLRDIYGDDTTDKMIEIGGIDIDSAAEEAVRVDGWAHFMNTYDGNYHTTKAGFVYFRTQ